MQMRNGWLGAAILVWWLVSPAPAQQGVRWLWSLDNARQVAGQTNRLVLVHFWADWCVPCQNMDRDVFSRPEVAAALEADFVPVKLHRDHFPASARQYGVTAIPADVILTPQGQVLEKFEGASDVNQYVARLGRVATAYRTQSGRAYAQIPPQPSGGAAAGSQPPPYGTEAPQNQSRATDYYGRGPVPATVPVNPAYAGRATVDPAASPAPQTPSPWSPPPQNPAVPPQGPAAGPPNPSVAMGTGVELPPGHPPLALDGYCPVQLTEKERWVLGNRRWGVRHEGRTYLFAGPEEQSRFYANPDRYAPAMSGDDVVLLTEQGRQTPGRREHGVWFQDRVYLFSSEATLQKFSADPNRYVARLAQLKTGLATRPDAGPSPAQSQQPAPWGDPSASSPGTPRYR